MKKDFQDVLDPFCVGQGWFILEFPSLIVRANPMLLDEDLTKVNNTIKRLKLNDDRFVNDRNTWLAPYCLGEATFSLLKKMLHLSRMS